MFLIRFVIRESFQTMRTLLSAGNDHSFIFNSNVIQPYPCRFLFPAVCISGWRLMHHEISFCIHLISQGFSNLTIGWKTIKISFLNRLPNRIVSEFHAVWHFACSFAGVTEATLISVRQSRSWLNHEKNYVPHSVYVWLQKICFEIQMI